MDREHDTTKNFELNTCEDLKLIFLTSMDPHILSQQNTSKIYRKCTRIVKLCEEIGYKL